MKSGKELNLRVAIYMSMMLLIVIGCSSNESPVTPVDGEETVEALNNSSSMKCEPGEICERPTPPTPPPGDGDDGDIEFETASDIGNYPGNNSAHSWASSSTSHDVEYLSVESEFTVNGTTLSKKNEMNNADYVEVNIYINYFDSNSSVICTNKATHKMKDGTIEDSKTIYKNRYF